MDLGVADDDQDLAGAALGLVGSPFRLHGRNPMTGLDCVGLVAAAMAATGRSAAFPTGYTLKRSSIGSLENIAGPLGYCEAIGPVRRGDVVLYRVGPCQFHFGIAAGEGKLVHAHAGLRRVICGEASGDWEICGHWRRADTA